MSFRRKLLLVFSTTVFVVVLAVVWSVSAFTRSAFERVAQERTLELVQQFQREFNRRGEEVVERTEAIARGDATLRMAQEIAHAQPDYSTYISEAKTIAESHQLDFLEFVDSEGRIISSAQWPAKFGYKDSSLNLTPPAKQAYLKDEQLPHGSALGLFALRAVNNADRPLYVAGGRRLDSDFLAALALPSGMRAMLYDNGAASFSPQFLILNGPMAQDSGALAPLIQSVTHDGHEQSAVIHWSSSRMDDENMHAIPLASQDGGVAGVLLIGNSLRPYIELNRRIRSIAFLVGGAGILLAVFISSWAAGRAVRPIEQLVGAARSVAAGDMNTRIEVGSRDELGELANAFNRMTRELLDQRERLVQAERVAAWRELAHRLAHELKNPLFPLQLTVENLIRAHDQSPQIFEEMFRESTSTLLAEIANLKSTIGRFSEFSKMPEPQFQEVDLNDLLQQVLRIFQAQLGPGAKIQCRLSLDEALPPIAADGGLLHRAISNLVLNAMDAMPDGGTLTLHTQKQDADKVLLQISDTGIGLTQEECDRLFTPYYTTKQHGTGLGLAIVQSIVSDHQGRVAVESSLGQGTTFTIELRRNRDKLRAAPPQSAVAG